MKWLLQILLLLISIPSYSQELEGTWVGNFPNNPFASDTRKLVVKLNVHENDGISGTTYLDYGSGYHEYYQVVGTFNRTKGILYFKEVITLSKRMPSGQYNRLGNYTLKMIRTSSSITWRGVWHDNREEDLIAIAPSEVYMRRSIPQERLPSAPFSLPPVAKKTTSSPKPIEKKEPPKQVATELPKPAPTPKTPTKKPRTVPTINDIQSTIKITEEEKDSIRVELIDNAEIDNDRVSIYVDDKLVIRNQTITKEPLVFYLSLSEAQPTRKLKMVAESLGDTPPCTAYLRISTATKQMGISLSSEWNKNGVVQFFLE